MFVWTWSNLLGTDGLGIHPLKLLECYLEWKYCNINDLIKKKKKHNSISKSSLRCLISTFTNLAFFGFLCFVCLMRVLCAQARRPFHHPVIFARAQHVHHIIRQESIFNISEHHNPRAGHRGRLREEDLPVTWPSTREGQAARDWGTESQTATNKSAGKTEKKKCLHLIRNSRFIREHINANSCKRMHGAEPAPQEEVVFNRNDDSFLGRWNHVMANAW